MSAPKTIAIVLMSLFLSLSLSVFGFLFSLRMTALNASYVTARLDNLPLATLVAEAELNETFEDNPEMVELIESVIIDNEVELKQRTTEAIHIVYDYLNGRSQSLDLALILKDTILEPGFTISIIEQADLTPLTRELITNMMSEVELPYGLSIEPHLDDIAQQIEPWLKEQAAIAIPPIYDYILGQSQNTDIVISLESVEESLKDILRQDFLASPPPEFAGLSHTELEEEFDGIFSEIADDIDPTIDIGAELADSDIQSDVAGSLADTGEAFGESKRYIGYFNLGYGLLIGFIVLLVAGIILIYRQVKGATCTLGGILLGYGFFNLIAVFIARGITSSQLAKLDDMPLSLQTWLTQLTTSSLTPLLILAIVLLVIGATLLAVSFIYQRRYSQTETPL